MTIYLSIVLYRRIFFLKGVKLVFVGMVIVLIRMLLPFNFSISVTIPITYILPELNKIMFRPFGNTNIFVGVLILWIIGTFFKLVFEFIRNMRLNRVLQSYQNGGGYRRKQVENILDEFGMANIRVIILPENISPSITGLIKPTLIFPDQDYATQHLRYMIRHEIEHFKHHDLWLKKFIGIVSCIYWWNPFVYLIKRKLHLALELSNDSTVIRNMTNKEKIQYVECLVEVAKMSQKDNKHKSTIPFIYSENDLKVRVSGILNDVYSKKCNSTFSLIVNINILLFLVLGSIFFIPEAYGITHAAKENTFVIEKDNSYFIKTSKGYDLYIENVYVATMEKIDSTLKNLIIYGEER
ncbi:M56 family metallopeptidase [Blautia schinkii]|nr:M56 family metallopeptidase [Blautia schinkii]